MPIAGERATEKAHRKTQQQNTDLGGFFLLENVLVVKYPLDEEACGLVDVDVELGGRVEPPDKAAFFAQQVQLLLVNVCRTSGTQKNASEIEGVHATGTRVQSSARGTGTEHAPASSRSHLFPSSTTGSGNPFGSSTLASISSFHFGTVSYVVGRVTSYTSIAPKASL